MELGQEWLIVLDDYTIMQHLGKGSYGQVVKAKHNLTNKVVAIKHLKI